MKQCVHCRLQLEADAKRCPHCHMDQKESRPPVYFWACLSLIGIAFATTLFADAYSKYRTADRGYILDGNPSGVAFTPDRIVLSKGKMRPSDPEGPIGNLLGSVSNQTKEDYRAFEFEISVVSTSGEVLDVAMSRIDTVIPAGQTRLVKIRFPAELRMGLIRPSKLGLLPRSGDLANKSLTTVAMSCLLQLTHNFQWPTTMLARTTLNRPWPRVP